MPIDTIGAQRAPRGARATIMASHAARWFYGALILALAAWVLHSFLQALLAACVTAIASWPLYRSFVTRMEGRLSRNAIALVFTSAICVFVLAPLLFAFGALVNEAYALLQQLAAADTKGIPVPDWLERVPGAGVWAAAKWQIHLSQPGALSMWAQQTHLASLVGWAQSLGQFMARHLFIVLFTILLLFVLYQHGERLSLELRRWLRDVVGGRAEGHVDLAIRAARASVNSMLVVGLFNGFATGIAYAIAGVSHAAVWAAIIGALALVPFLGYVAVAALALQLATAGAASTALAALVLGCVVLFCGDKIVRPIVAGQGTPLPLVWILIGCLGGFEVLGLVGVVIGPVALTLVRELWAERIRDLDLAERRATALPTPKDSNTNAG